MGAVQLPLYTLWADPRPAHIAYAVVHCTAGGVLIGMTALFLALILNGAGARAGLPENRIVIWTIVAAVAYTVWSELINLAQGNWTYSAWMPVLPGIDVGLAPLLQWIVVPLVAWRWANRQR